MFFHRLLVIIILFVFGGCSPLYVPNTVYTPLHKEGGEVMVSGNFGTSGFNFHTSGSNDNGNFLMFNYARKRRLSKDTGHIDQNDMGVVNIGFYYNGNGYTRMEFLGGAGYGRSEAYVNLDGKDTPGAIAIANYGILPLQFNIAHSTENIAYGFTGRANFLMFFDLNYKNENISKGIDGLSVFLEPAFFAKGGFENIKFFAQAGVSIPNIWDKGNIIVPYEPWMASIGIEFKFYDLF